MPTGATAWFNAWAIEPDRRGSAVANLLLATHNLDRTPLHPAENWD